MRFGNNDYYPVETEPARKAEIYYVVQKQKTFPLPSYLLSMTERQERELHSNSVFRSGDFFLDRLLEDKVGVDALMKHLWDREKLKDRHLDEISSSISYCKSRIWDLDMFYLGRNRSIDQTRNLFTGKILDLEHERRAVEGSAWKDEAGLLKDFLDAWTGYRRDSKTYSFLSDEPGSSPTPRDETPAGYRTQ